MLERHVDLDALHHLPDAGVKNELTKLKGVGEWTSDIYLMMAMLRPDVMPKGDVAPQTAWHKLSGEPRPTSDEFLLIANGGNRIDRSQRNCCGISDRKC